MVASLCQVWTHHGGGSHCCWLAPLLLSTWHETQRGKLGGIGGHARRGCVGVNVVRCRADTVCLCCACQCCALLHHIPVPSESVLVVLPRRLSCVGQDCSSAQGLWRQPGACGWHVMLWSTGVVHRGESVLWSIANLGSTCSFTRTRPCNALQPLPAATRTGGAV